MNEQRNEQPIPAEVKKATLRKMIQARSQILKRYPFYGYLLMHLQLGVEPCGSACTDMKHLLFDPVFAERLSEEEMIFVMLHEVLHCALEHCLRGREYYQPLFNIAADIVVNSNILHSMGIPEFHVAGIPAMHLTPAGQEGHLFSTEAVYQMLMEDTEVLILDVPMDGSGAGSGADDGVEEDSDDSAEDASGKKQRKKNADDEVEDDTEETAEAASIKKQRKKNAGDEEEDDTEESTEDALNKKQRKKNADDMAEEGSDGRAPGTIDSHEIWRTVEVTSAAADRWRAIRNQGAKKYSTEVMPPSVRDYIRDLDHEARVDWRAALQDFIQIFHDRFDYSFSPADRRYTGSDYVMPAFSEQETERVENLWFCVDTSGSISSDTLSEVMTEIQQAILLFEYLTGKISFFDTQVTDPIPFDETSDVRQITAVGGGGTLFSAIFQYLGNLPEEELPSAIVILTDGYSSYPEEAAAMDIPVLWILYDNPADPPWGRVIHLDS